MLIGLGFFHALRLTAAFPVVAVAIRWLLAALFFGLAVLTLIT